MNYYRQQAKLFEERMANVFGGVDNAPSGEQINMTFQKMAGMIDTKFSVSETDLLTI